MSNTFNQVLGCYHRQEEAANLNCATILFVVNGTIIDTTILKCIATYTSYRKNQKHKSFDKVL